MFVSKKFKVFILNQISNKIPLIIKINIPYEDLYIEKKYFNLFDIYDSDPFYFYIYFNYNKSTIINKNKRYLYAYYTNKWSIKYTTNIPIINNLTNLNNENYKKLLEPLKIIFSYLFNKKEKTIDFFNLFCLINQLKTLNILPKYNLISINIPLRNKMINYLNEYKNKKNKLKKKDIQLELRNFFPFNLYGDFYTQIFYYLKLFNNKKYKNLKNFILYLLLNTFELNNLNNLIINKLINYINGEFCLFSKLKFNDLFDKNINYNIIIYRLKSLIKNNYIVPEIKRIEPFNKINFNIIDGDKINKEFILMIEVYKSNYKLEVLNIFNDKNINIKFPKIVFKSSSFFYNKYFLYFSVESNNNSFLFTEIIFSLNGIIFKERIIV